jgi:hypothetical protein
MRYFPKNVGRGSRLDENSKGTPGADLGRLKNGAVT